MTDNVAKSVLRDTIYCNTLCEALKTEARHCDMEGYCLDFYSEDEKTVVFTKFPEAVIDILHRPNSDYIEYGPDDVERSG